MSERNAERARAALEAGYVIRPMRVSDAEAVADVHVRVWREAYRSLMPAGYLAALDVRDFAAHWRGRLTDVHPPSTRYVLAVRADGPVCAIGSAGLSRDDDPPTEWELWAINVLAGEHGTGVADLMMTHLVGDRPCSLWVLRGNDRAAAFYRRHGFRPDGATKLHPPTGTTEIRMVRAPRGE